MNDRLVMDIEQPPPIPRSSLRLVLLCIVLALVVSCAIPVGIYLYGIQRWESVQAGLRGKGEKLTAQEMVRPVVPDADNFFADPLWDELKNRTGSEVDEKPTGWDRLNPPVLGEEKQRLQSKYPGIAWPEKSIARNSVVLTAWNKKPENASPEELRRIANYIGESLAPAALFLDRMRALSKRPAVYYPLQFKEGVSMRLPHLKYLLQAGQLFSMRARAEIVLGNGSEAFADVLEILSLSNRVKDEPVLISHLVRISLMVMVVDVVAGGLKTRVWNDGQLRALDRLFASFDFFPELTGALRGERVCFNAMIESMCKGEIGKPFGTQPSGEKVSNTATTRIAFFAWYGLMGRFDQTAYNSLLQEWIEELQMVPASGVPAEPRAKQKLLDLKRTPFGKTIYQLTLLSAQSMFETQVKTAETEDRCRMMRVACALERYWLKNGQYPDSLAALVPEYFSKVPMDVVDREPFKYRLSPSGEYLLYSIGIDHRDDGGEPAYKFDPGDWVWGKLAKAPKGPAPVKAE